MAGAPARCGHFEKIDLEDVYKYNKLKLHMTMNKRYDTAPHRWEASVIICISDGRVHDSRQF